MMKIDEQGYKDGGAAFAKGKTLRWLLEQKNAADELIGYSSDDRIKRFDYVESVELGFADAVLAKLRSIR